MSLSGMFSGLQWFTFLKPMFQLFLLSRLASRSTAKMAIFQKFSILQHFWTVEKFMSTHIFLERTILFFFQNSKVSSNDHWLLRSLLFLPWKYQLYFECCFFAICWNLYTTSFIVSLWICVVLAKVIISYKARVLTTKNAFFLYPFSFRKFISIR